MAPRIVSGICMPHSAAFLTLTHSYKTIQKFFYAGTVGSNFPDATL
jgi:hypothetical protein